MFKALREKLLGASKQAEEELDPKLNLDYETFRPPPFAPSQSLPEQQGRQFCVDAFWPDSAIEGTPQQLHSPDQMLISRRLPTPLPRVRIC